MFRPSTTAFQSFSPRAPRQVCSQADVASDKALTRSVGTARAVTQSWRIFSTLTACQAPSSSRPAASTSSPVSGAAVSSWTIPVSVANASPRTVPLPVGIITASSQDNIAKAWLRSPIRANRSCNTS